MAQTGTNGHGPGARRIGPGSCVELGPKGLDEPGPMAHVAALLRVFLVRTKLTRSEPGLMVLRGPNHKTLKHFK